MAAGFKPDVISSDVHVLSINGPAFDLLHTMGKFLALGMQLPEIVACTTVNAARAIRRTGLGTLRTDAAGDASIFEVVDAPTEYRDVLGELIVGERRLVARGLVLNGRWWSDGVADSGARKP